MKNLYIALLFLVSTFLSAQNMLVVEKPGTVNNHIFYAGNTISIKTFDNETISGPINIIRDSTLVIDFVHEVKLCQIAVVNKQRYGLNLAGSALIGGGVLYMGLSLLNNQSINEQSLWSASGVIASGIIMKLFATKKMKIKQGKWRAKILVE